MKMSREGLMELVGHESISLTKYKDTVGVWTIGIGFTKSEIPYIASWPMDKKLSIKESFELLKKSIVRYETGINNALKVPVKQYQFDALVSWIYNVGTGWAKRIPLKKGEKLTKENKDRVQATVLNSINQGASNEQLYKDMMLFNKPKEIIPRREKEAMLLSTGKYSYGSKANVFSVSKTGQPLYSRVQVIDLNDYI